MEQTQRERIRNRDIPILARVLSAMQDVRAIESRIRWQEDRLCSLRVNLSGMPRAGGHQGGFDATIAELDDLCEQQKERMAIYMRELWEAERILNGIRNPRMRTFVTMLYVEGLHAGTIRRELNMTQYEFRRSIHAIEQAESMESVVWRDKSDGESGQFEKTLDSQGLTW
ncbi:MAG: hypothetical protein ACI4PG_06500 [Candidatus Ventricola sp.]